MTEVILGLVLVLVAVVWLILARANRIDLLHQKVTRAAATLEAQLLRRAGLALELAGSGELDPASSVLVAECADAALVEPVEDEDAALRPGRSTLSTQRGLAESELSQVLRHALAHDDVPVESELQDDVVAAWRRVAHARRFYNEAVAQVMRLRAKPSARLFHLAGRAQEPQTFEMDDTLPTQRHTAG